MLKNMRGQDEFECKFKTGGMVIMAEYKWGKKIILISMIFVMIFMSNIAFAETTSTWSASYSGVYYQYVNQFGGSDYDGLRWYNGNNVQVEVTYKNKLSSGSIVKRVIYLSSGETSAVGSISPGERVASVSVK